MMTPADLGPLADNGGPALTHVPKEWSAALEWTAFGEAGCGTSTPVDQRGATRPANSACDTGAVERNEYDRG